MNEETFKAETDEIAAGYNHVGGYTPVLTRDAARAVRRASQAKIDAEAATEADNAEHRLGVYHGYFAQTGNSTYVPQGVIHPDPKIEYWEPSPEHSWKPEHWKFMNETEWKDETKKGDGEAYDHVGGYTPVHTKAAQKRIRAASQAKINAEAAIQAKNAEHQLGAYHGYYAQIGNSTYKPQGIINPEPTLDYYEPVPEHSWKPEHWKFMNESEWRTETKAGDGNDYDHVGTYTPVLTKARVLALKRAKAAKIYADAIKEAANAEHRLGVYHGYLAQQESGEPWDVSHWKHMNEKQFATDAPNGYNEHQKYTKFLTKEQVTALKEGEKQDVVDEAAKLAAEGGHEKEFFKSYA
jgi:ribosomal protein S16